jgi:flagellin FlaB
MAMGTLIIFIAVVLIAAVAAAVLISTTTTLQNKALSTGKATTSEVGTGIKVVNIYAENGADGTVEEFKQLLKLAAGSNTITFNDALLTVDVDDSSRDYEYAPSATCDGVTGSEYAVEYVINGTNHRDDYLVNGDMAKLCYEAPRSLEESEDVRISFIPKTGTIRTVETTLPSLIISEQVGIYP